MKKSFILHIDSLSILDELDFEQKGKLFDAIYQYQKGNNIDLDMVTKIAFLPFKNQFIRDNEKHTLFAESQSEKGKKSAEKRKLTKLNQTQPKVTSVKLVQPNLTESTYNVSVSDSKNNSDNKKEREITLQVVIDYFSSKGYSEESGRKFYDYYSTSNWVDTNGKKVKSWKQKAIGVWFKPENLKKVAPKKYIHDPENVW